MKSIPEGLLTKSPRQATRAGYMRLNIESGRCADDGVVNQARLCSPDLLWHVLGSGPRTKKAPSTTDGAMAIDRVIGSGWEGKPIRASANL